MNGVENTYNGCAYKKLLCKDVWKFSVTNNIEEENAFPYFICDVKIAKLETCEAIAAFEYLKYGFEDIPKSNKYTLVCMDSGEVCIELICRSVSDLAYCMNEAE